jgi:NADH:ubiquinone oxidoreductase subunit C
MGWIKAAQWMGRARELEADGWELVDLCGVDRVGLLTTARSRPPDAAGVGFLEASDERFEVVVQLLHRQRRERHSVHVLAGGEPPTVPSIVEVWPTANFMEREAFDMFGIRFEGHPNLTRILMPDEWEGYPLRKDYGVGKVPVEFIPQPFLQIDAPGQAPEGEEAGAELDRLGQSGTPQRAVE